MADVLSRSNGLPNGAPSGTQVSYQLRKPTVGEVEESPSVLQAADSRPPYLSSTPSQTSNHTTNKSVPTNNGASSQRSETVPSALLDDRIPDNMYLPDKSEDKESWIHRDKLAKIESEELQAAGVSLAKVRTRNSTKFSSPPPAGSSLANRDSVNKREDKRQRLNSPAEIEEELDRAAWDVRLPEEIDAEAQAASQMYTNPVLRKSGSKIPILTSSPVPIPAERYERDTPLARKRAASGTMSFEAGDPSVGKARTNGVSSPSTVKTSSEDEDTTPNLPSSFGSQSAGRGSPQKQRVGSANLASPSSNLKKAGPSQRKVSAPARNSPTPSLRPHTRDGSLSDRARTSMNKPEGEPPWLATMYKPDPMLPPDQQIIPTIAKKQMQQQWERENAIPKTYDTGFEPMAVHSGDHLPMLPKDEQNTNHERNANSMVETPQQPTEEVKDGEELRPIQPPTSVSAAERPGTSGSLTAGYSTMPRLSIPPIRESGPSTHSRTNSYQMNSRGTTQPAPMKMQATSLAEDEKVEKKEKKGCGCCVVM